jgi:DNA-binding transcriptional regulator YiaG
MHVAWHGCTCRLDGLRHPDPSAISMPCLFLISRHRATTKGVLMASISRELVAQCRLALQLTPQQFGDMVGCTKRTIQRWEDRGALVLVDQARTIAVALRRSHPEIAQQVAASMNMTLDQLAGYQCFTGKTSAA